VREMELWRDKVRSLADVRMSQTHNIYLQDSIADPGSNPELCRLNCFHRGSVGSTNNIFVIDGTVFPRVS
jgi:hypothetical protein